jgi:hypothetical protein
LFAPLRLAAARVGLTTLKIVRDHENGASPSLTWSKRQEEPEAKKKDQRTTLGEYATPPFPRPEAGIGFKHKKRVTPEVGHERAGNSTPSS